MWDWRAAEALWKQLAADVSVTRDETVLAEAMVDNRILCVTMQRHGFASGDVGFDRPTTVLDARPTPGRRGLLFPQPITDEELDLLNQNAWEHFNEMDPEPPG